MTEQASSSTSIAENGADDRKGAWLTRSCLLLGGDLGLEGTDAVRVSLVSDKGSETLEARYFSAPSLDVEGSVARGGMLIAILPRARHDLERGSLLIEAGEHSVNLAGRHLRALTDDPSAVVQEAVAPLEGPARSDAVAFLGSVLNLVPESEQRDLSEKLLGLRKSLRQRLPAAVVSKAERRGIHIDRIMAVDERSFYCEGWMHQEDFKVVRLTAISPEGVRCELLDRIFRHPRPDVAEFFALEGRKLQQGLGFVCFFELGAPSLMAEGWVLEIEYEHGVAFEIEAPPVVSDTLEVRDGILHDPFIERLPDDELMSNHVFPAITRIQDRMGTEVNIETVFQYGAPPGAPEVSVVIPLYLNIEHLEVQFAHFANDPELFEADLVYVLDSPQQAEELRNYAADLLPIYQLPFRVAVLERNVGFPGACNAGAAVARGRLLLLLNSDVLPDRPGWLGMLRHFYDGTPEIGALGPKLIYEDDSIQHGGMYFHRPPGSAYWLEAQRFKGLHRSLPAANVVTSVPAVSGACLMVSRDLYEECGGLPRNYVHGDYEDFHLCMELASRGRSNWYLPSVELYHLEAQSYAANDVRRANDRYNMWLHNRLWRDQIETLMESYGAEA